ncbi:MAG: glycosyltransferase family 4 protein [bacterium]|nr:glycosyltransferase family 4 protein [bacterium]
MKILLVTWYFPPSRTIAAVRLGKLAAYLLAQGHDLRVLTPQDPPLPQDLALDFPIERVIRTPWSTADGSCFKRAQNIAAAGQVPDDGAAPSWLKRKYWHLQSGFAAFPDSQITWRPFALRTGGVLLSDWRPDLIYASGPPFTTLLVGQELSKRFELPLVVEFRDRWSDDPYSPPLFWRRWQERRAEETLIDQAAALVTVSEPWAKAYRGRYEKPTAVIHNGYDAELCSEGPFDGAIGMPGLEIIYTGGIYPGYRDPSPLFAAMKRLDDKGLACRMR